MAELLQAISQRAQLGAGSLKAVAAKKKPHNGAARFPLCAVQINVPLFL